MRRRDLLLVGLAWPAFAQPMADADTIRHLLHTTFDRPEAPLSVEPLVVAGDYAIAGWAQEGRGGRALLRRGHGGWAIALCSGDALKGTALLLDIGIPRPDAERLATDLATAEARLPPARLVLLASFEGVMMLEGGDHATAHTPHAH